MRKVLIAVDDSACSFRAVDYAGKQLSGLEGLHITLLHVLPYPPASMWDHGYMATGEKEKEERDRKIEQWIKDQRARAEPIFEKAAGILSEYEIGMQQVEKKTISDSTNIADAILEEARNAGYQTIIIGRKEHSPAEELLLGSVSAKIVRHGSGLAVCVVG